MIKKGAEMARRPYRLGLDIGTNSLGWALLFLNGKGEPCEEGPLGVRIFSDGRDPKTKATLATERRTARAQRRRRDRYVKRRARLLEVLTQHGLMPADARERRDLARATNPYQLRAEGLARQLSLAEFGRILFHLNQRRGFKSNRKAERARKKDEDAGMIESGVRQLRAEMARLSCPTLGAYLFQRSGKGEWVRARPSVSEGDRHYAFYPDRALVTEEFDALWEKQASFYPNVLTPQLRTLLRDDIIFHQRPLKPKDPGKCTFVEGEPRAPWAHPLAQRFRFLVELAALRLLDEDGRQRPLTVEERDILARFAWGEAKDHKPKEKIKFQKMRALLGVPDDWRFNIEDEHRDELLADEVGAKLGHKNALGPLWLTLDIAARAELVARLLEEEDEPGLLGWLMGRFGIDEQRARTVARAPLPEGHCRLSVVALEKIVGCLEGFAVTDEDSGRQRPCVYSEAVEAAGWHHSDFRTGEVLATLPYYGEVLAKEVVDPGYNAGSDAAAKDALAERFGWIANPTVHIGLNQVRHVVNELIERYGPPAEIVIEVTRELKQSKKKRDQIRRQNTANQKDRAAWRGRLQNEAEIGNPSGRDMLKMRLWHEMPAQRRCCVFCGQPLSFAQVISAETEVEHILPFSRSLDDSFTNKVLAHTNCNRLKANRTPHEAFGHLPDGPYAFPAILSRARELSPRKYERFLPDAQAEMGDFLARHLTDTSYLATIARRYVSAVCNPNRVWMVPGRLTALLRGKWGLNNVPQDSNVKNRNDHRHHAVDAFVIACTSRSTLQAVSRAAARTENAGVNRIVDDMPPPFPGFDFDRFVARVRKVIVSFKPDHGHRAQMHNDTAYGIVGDPTPGKAQVVVRRVPLETIGDPDKARLVRDPHLKEALLTAFATRRADEPVPAMLARLSAELGVRRVRIEEKLQVIPIRSRDGRAYKGVKGDGNWCMAIYRDPASGIWRGSPISTFDAHALKERGQPLPLPFEGAEEVMRLFRDDLIAIDDPAHIGAIGGRRVLRVVKFSGNKLVTADHNEAGNLKLRNETSVEIDPFKYIERTIGWYQQQGMRKVGISPAGRLRDPGRPKDRVAAE